MASLRPSFHTMLARDFVDDIYYNRKNLYYFLGKVDPWGEFVDQVSDQDACDCTCSNCLNVNGTLITMEFGDNANPHKDPDYAYFHETNIRDNIVYMHKVSPSDVSQIVRSHKWRKGTYYSEWDNTQDMTKLDSSNPFYVVNSEYNVYKCLNNGKYLESDGVYKSLASEVEPKGIHYDVLRTSDGYLWKYMYSIPPAKRNKFVNSNYIPIQRSVDDTFYNRGSVEQITIVDPGSGYTSEPKTFAVIPDPEEGGVAAKVSLFINKVSGSIDGYVIDNEGSGYTGSTINITIEDRAKTGSGLFENHPSAILTGIIENGSLKYVVIHDPGKNYSPDTATTLVVSGDGTGCVAYPRVLNGEIVGVVITDGGSGYTFADINVVCSNTLTTKANLTASIGGIITSNDQAVVEQLAVPGAIYAVNVVEGGGDYTSGTEVIITGDGEGATGHCVVVNGRVTQVIIDNYGKGYTRAEVSFFDRNRKTPNLNPEAQGYAILPPIKGHGYNAPEELYSKSVSIYINIRSDNLLAGLNQEFRQFGLIENVRDIKKQKTVTINEATVLYTITIEPPVSISDQLGPDSIVHIHNTPYRVVSVDNYTYKLQQFSSTFKEISIGDIINYIDPETQRTYNLVVREIDQTPDIDKYSGDLLILNNNVPFRFQSGKTFGMRTYLTF